MTVSLFENAVASIRLGMEDYRANDPARLLSAVRNYHSGISLLAKEVLLRAAIELGMNAPEEILAARYKPVISEEGEAVIVADGHNTVDHQGLKTRFKDFGIDASIDLLGDLSKVRNQIEHHYTDVPHDALRAVIGKTFPLVQQLFEILEEAPAARLGEAWTSMLELTAFYDAQREICQATFKDVRWRFPFMSEIEWQCPKCQSPLLAQKNPDNTTHDDIEGNCRACGSTHDAPSVIVFGLDECFAGESYAAEKDGGDPPVGLCAECGEDAYIQTAEVNGCAWCDLVLGDCYICSTGLSPSTVSADDSKLCSTCDHRLSRDD